LESAVDQAAQGRPDGLVVIHDTLTVNYRARIAAAALKHGLPSICASSPFVDAGGLIAYAPSLPRLFKRAAVFVDRIFRGAKPGDIPIEQPTKFELRINLRTARALGITIPPTLIAWADEAVGQRARGSAVRAHGRDEGRCGAAGAGELTPAVVTELVPLGPFATWQAERAIGDHNRSTLHLRLDPQADVISFGPGMTVWIHH
jgi:hypothetical protein